MDHLLTMWWLVADSSDYILTDQRLSRHRYSSVQLMNYEKTTLSYDAYICSVKGIQTFKSDKVRIPMGMESKLSSFCFAQTSGLIGNCILSPGNWTRKVIEVQQISDKILLPELIISKTVFTSSRCTHLNWTDLKLKNNVSNTSSSWTQPLWRSS